MAIVEETSRLNWETKGLENVKRAQADVSELNKEIATQKQRLDDVTESTSLAGEEIQRMGENQRQTSILTAELTEALVESGIEATAFAAKIALWGVALNRARGRINDLAREGIGRFNTSLATGAARLGVFGRGLQSALAALGPYGAALIATVVATRELVQETENSREFLGELEVLANDAAMATATYQEGIRALGVELTSLVAIRGVKDFFAELFDAPNRAVRSLTNSTKEFIGATAEGFAQIINPARDYDEIRAMTIIREIDNNRELERLVDNGRLVNSELVKLIGSLEVQDEILLKLIEDQIAFNQSIEDWKEAMTPAVNSAIADAQRFNREARLTETFGETVAQMVLIGEEFDAQISLARQLGRSEREIATLVERRKRAMDEIEEAALANVDASAQILDNFNKLDEETKAYVEALGLGVSFTEEQVTQAKELKSTVEDTNTAYETQSRILAELEGTIEEFSEAGFDQSVQASNEALLEQGRILADLEGRVEEFTEEGFEKSVKDTNSALQTQGEILAQLEGNVQEFSEEGFDLAGQSMVDSATTSAQVIVDGFKQSQAIMQSIETGEAVNIGTTLANSLVSTLSAAGVLAGPAGVAIGGFVGVASGIIRGAFGKKQEVILVNTRELADELADALGEFTLDATTFGASEFARQLEAQRTGARPSELAAMGGTALSGGVTPEGSLVLEFSRAFNEGSEAANEALETFDELSDALGVSDKEAEDLAVQIAKFAVAQRAVNEEWEVTEETFKQLEQDLEDGGKAIAAYAGLVQGLRDQQDQLSSGFADFNDALDQMLFSIKEIGASTEFILRPGGEGLRPGLFAGEIGGQIEAMGVRFEELLMQLQTTEDGFEAMEIAQEAAGLATQAYNIQVENVTRTLNEELAQSLSDLNTQWNEASIIIDNLSGIQAEYNALLDQRSAKERELADLQFRLSNAMEELNAEEAFVLLERRFRELFEAGDLAGAERIAQEMQAGIIQARSQALIGRPEAERRLGIVGEQFGDIFATREAEIQEQRQMEAQRLIESQLVQELGIAPDITRIARGAETGRIEGDAIELIREFIQSRVQERQLQLQESTRAAIEENKRVLQEELRPTLEGLREDVRTVVGENIEDLEERIASAMRLIAEEFNLDPDTVERIIFAVTGVRPAAEAEPSH